MYGEEAWRAAMDSADDICRHGNLFKKENFRWVLNRSFFEQKKVSFNAFVDFFEKCAKNPNTIFPAYVKVMGWTDALWIHDMPRNEKNGDVAFDDFKNLRERRSKKRKGDGEEALSIARDMSEVKRLKERFNSPGVWS